MRKLASIKKIDEIRPIEGADAIECAVLGGWTVVTKKGEYRAGDLAVYCEIDAFIPHGLAPFLSKGQPPREYNGVKGERLRSIKLRGQLSQGLLIRVGDRFDDVVVLSAENATPYKEGDDVTEALGIQKYEPPVPACLAGEAKALFPGFIPKTDQERIQNLTEELKFWQERNFTWEVTEKLDGSSMTVYVRDGEAGVCSRNLELRQTENNSLWKVAVRDQLIEKIRSTGLNLALQGELVGEGIQCNRYGFSGQKFFVFDVYDIDAGRYYTPALRQKLCKELNIDHVPVIGVERKLTSDTVDSLLAQAEGKNQYGSRSCEREGLVFKCVETEASFKCISNKFLLKGGE